MISVFLGAAVTCFAALFLGQAILRLAGASEWSWLAPAVGFSALMLAATPAIHVPGRTTTVAVVLALLSVAAAVWVLRSPPQRPPLVPLLAALPVVGLAALPFLAAGRGGILGVGVNNDMAAHLIFVEGYLSSAVTAVTPLPRDYPLGPHAVAAALSDGLGIHADLAFSGLTMAIPVIGAWTAQAAARGASWLGRVVLATVVAMPFLVAAYYGEGAFKEVGQAVLVLAVVLALAGCGPRLRRGRWVPVALLVGGIISVYSLPGLTWVLAVGGLWLAGLLAIAAYRRRLREVPARLRGELPALGIGLATLVVALLPQAHRMWEFLSLREAGSGIAVSDVGNLVGPLPGWEAFGVWGNADFRFPAPGLGNHLWIAFVVVLVVLGAAWALRRGRWLIPLAAVGAMAIWQISSHSQSPYVSAKGLVIASPLLLLVAVQPLVDRDSGRRRSWPWLVVPLLGLVLFLVVARDDVRALRWSPVGPTSHARQIESFRPLIAGRPTLFFGTDEFIDWELADVPVEPVAASTGAKVPLRPLKHWEYGQALDFDSVRAATLNEYEWFVTSRDAAASGAPPQLHPVRSTADFELWRRVGQVRERSILGEGEWPGAVLECQKRKGRAVLARGGVAAVRGLPWVTPVPPVAAGGIVSVEPHLPVGSWELTMAYTSPYPVKVTAPGLDATLPANLDRLGPRLPVGRLDVRRPGPLEVSFQVEDTVLAPATAVAAFSPLVATPVGRDRVVPIARACGRYVDWYRSAR